MVVAERIKSLGVIQVEDVGMIGNVAELLYKIKGSILKDALVGEH